MNDRDDLFEKMREKLVAAEPASWDGISDVRS
jgi:hypothetical protein